MSKLTEYLDEQRDLERFDMSKEALREIASIGKEIMSLSKKKNADGRKTLSRLKDLEDELHFTIQDLESYLAGG
jgi:hypothetical protein